MDGEYGERKYLMSYVKIVTSTGKRYGKGDEKYEKWT
jgi:hypothetical protein